MRSQLTLKKLEKAFQAPSFVDSSEKVYTQEKPGNSKSKADANSRHFDNFDRSMIQSVRVHLENLSEEQISQSESQPCLNHVPLQNNV